MEKRIEPWIDVPDPERDMKYPFPADHPLRAFALETAKMHVWVRMLFCDDKTGDWFAIADQPAEERWEDDMWTIDDWLGLSLVDPWCQVQTPVGLAITMTARDAMMFKLTFGIAKNERPSWADR